MSVDISSTCEKPNRSSSARRGLTFIVTSAAFCSPLALPGRTYAQFCQGRLEVLLADPDPPARLDFYLIRVVEHEHHRDFLAGGPPRHANLAVALARLLPARERFVEGLSPHPHLGLA